LNKIVSTKRTSAIFLAIVLVLGTIALTIPSFSVEAQATKDRDNDYDNDYEDKKSYDKDDYKSEYSSYGKYDDRDYDKYKKDSNNIFVKKVKCNNINVNLNGIDVNIGLPNNDPVTNPVALAQEVEDDDEEIESNSIESDEDESYKGRDRQSDSNTNSRIVCINNNNNIVGEEEPEITCEECFTENLDEEQLENLTNLLTRTDVEDLEGLCEALSDSTLTNLEKFNGLAIIFSAAEITDEDAFFKVLECLEDLGLISLPTRGGDGPER
jgi:hypothetical protein